MPVRVSVAPGLLKWAVERAGWDDDTTQRRAPKLDEWISGDRQPTLKQLESFAQATHTPFGLLFLPEPPNEPVPIPDMRTVGNAAVPRPSADLLDTIYICQTRQSGTATTHAIMALPVLSSWVPRRPTRPRSTRPGRCALLSTSA